MAGRLFTGLSFAALLSSVSGADERPSFVLVLVDDLGWRDLGCEGAELAETPRIDALAAEGLRFTRAYACAANCAPSRAGLLTGLDAPRHGIYTVGSSARGEASARLLVPTPNTTTLADEHVTLAEALAPAGYACAAIGKWHLGRDPRTQGFQHAVAGGRAGHPKRHFSPYGVPDLEDGPEGESLAERLTDEAIAFLRAHREEPFLLYLSHYAVHTPVQAREETTARYEARGLDGRRARYAAMVAELDAAVGRLLDALEELELAGRTLVLLTSDNGGHARFSDTSPLRGSKGMLYEGGLRVPLIARWPGRIEPGTTCDEPVIGMDLYPTLLELAGVAEDARPPLDGASLAPLFAGAGGLERAALYWHFPAYLEPYLPEQRPWRETPSGALLAGDWKLIERFETGRVELYDLAADPGETTDLAAAEPERAAALREELGAWRERTDAPVPTERNPEYEPGGDRR